MADYNKLGAGILGKILKAMNSKPANLVGEGLSAYANPPMWGYEKLAEKVPWIPTIPEIPVVGPIYERAKGLPKEIVEKMIEQPPPGWKRPPTLGNPGKGRWPRKNLRQPVRKNKGRPIGKMGPIGGAMPLAPSSSAFLDAIRRIAAQGRPAQLGDPKRGGLAGLFGGQTGPNVIDSWRRGQRTAANTASTAVGNVFGKAGQRSAAQQVAARLKKNWFSPSYTGLMMSGGGGP